MNQIAAQGRRWDFGAMKAAVASHLEAADKIICERGDETSRQQLAELQEKLESNRFYLAVLGQFKRGKTTLINSLLGADVLPVAVVPLTSIITLLRYGDAPAVTVEFLSGQAQRIRMEELAEYVTERSNPQNVKGVKHVEVRYPSPYLAQGILLVDTPGVGSTYEHNTEVTHSFLAQVDAAIFLVSVDPPLTQVEAEFLRRAREEVHHFFFLLNKTDLMSEAEMRESLAFTAAQIRQQAGMESLDLFPLSARMALEAKKAGDLPRLESSGLPAFETALQQFLMEDKGKVLLQSLLSDALRLASGLRFELEVERKAMAVPVQELEEKQAALAREIGRIQQERDDMNVLLKNEINRLVASVERDLHEHVDGSVGCVLKKLDEFYRAHADAGKAELSRLLDQFMTEQVEAVFNAWRLAEDRRMAEVFRSMSARFTEKANAIIRNIRSITSRLFDIAVETFESPEELSAETHLYYKTDPLFYFAVEKVTFILPKFLFRAHLLNKMRDKVRMEMERNAGRIRFDYLERIEKSTHGFRAALNAKVDATLQGIHQALERAADRKRRSSADYEQQAQTFSRQAGELDRIVAGCRASLAQVEG